MLDYSKACSGGSHCDCESDGVQTQFSFTGYPSMPYTSTINIFHSVHVIFVRIFLTSRISHCIKLHHAPNIWMFLPILSENYQIFLFAQKSGKSSISGRILHFRNHLLDWLPHPVHQPPGMNALLGPTFTSLFPRTPFDYTLTKITLLILPVLAKTLVSVISTLIQP